MRALLYTDGGARGNPGPAAIAYVLEAEDGTVLASQGEAIGVATNNVAEYAALVSGLGRAIELAIGRGRGALGLGADGEADARRVPGQEPGSQELFLDASRLALQLEAVTYTHVRREHNELADRILNDVLDAA